MLATHIRRCLRVSEAVELRVEDIKSYKSMIHVQAGKGYKERYTILPDRLLRQLRQYWVAYRPETYLFPSTSSPDKPMNRTTVHKIFHKAKSDLGITEGRGVHTLRHCFATHLLDTGCDPFTIKWLLGDSSIKSPSTVPQSNYSSSQGPKKPPRPPLICPQVYYKRLH